MDKQPSGLTAAQEYKLRLAIKKFRNIYGVFGEELTERETRKMVEPILEEMAEMTLKVDICKALDIPVQVRAEDEDVEGI